ncbi:hypothetical protein AVEN_16511-1 [Araneus ventricosus]|uniref:Uncharacterized protein n=1 Tax=Araneus ventricosus TaxID=182803 RepID=A0A4Y2T2R8_ARAVE|nr:hypothetical protein AVEN_16511-1 [Araneus ventricosus]
MTASILINSIDCFVSDNCHSITLPNIRGDKSNSGAMTFNLQTKEQKVERLWGDFLAVMDGFLLALRGLPNPSADRWFRNRTLSRDLRHSLPSLSHKLYNDLSPIGGVSRIAEH